MRNLVKPVWSFAAEAEPEGGDPNPEGTEPEGTEEQQPQAGSVDDLPEWARKALSKANSEAASYRTKLREAEPYVSKAKELEEQSKTETQRLSEDRDGHKARADQAEGELLRLRVGLAKGLTEAQAKRLVGSSKEELEADADDLIATFRGGSTSSKPTPRLRGGGEPEDEPSVDAKKVVEDLPRF